MRVLAYPKFKLDAAQQHELLADYLPWTEVVAMMEPPPVTPACRDPHDVPFLELARAANANVLITGDADLFCLAPLAKLQLLTPAGAIKLLSTSG